MSWSKWTKCLQHAESRRNACSRETCFKLTNDPDSTDWRSGLAAPTHTTTEAEDLSGWCEQLVASLQPPETDAAARAAFVQHLRTVLAPLLTPVGGTLDVFGSSATGLHLPGADVDLVLSLGKDTNREINGEIVKRLATQLRSAECSAGFAAFASVNAIPGARVPIVTVASNEFGLTADISVNNKLPLANTQLLRTYMLIDDRVRRLCYVVKRWAKQRRLSEAFDHTPSSYAWVLLVIFYGQQQGLLPNLQQDHDANTPLFNAEFLTPDRRRVRCRFCTDVDAASRRLAEAASSRLTGQGGPAVKAEATDGGGAEASLGALVLGFFQWLARADLQRHIISIRAGVALDASSKHWGAGTHGGRSKERHLFQIEVSRKLAYIVYDRGGVASPRPGMTCAQAPTLAPAHAHPIRTPSISSTTSGAL